MPLPLATLNGWLQEAQQARHQLAIGDKDVEVMAFGRKRVFNRVTIDDLDAYIDTLKRDIATAEAAAGVVIAPTRTRSAISVYFGG